MIILMTMASICDNFTKEFGSLDTITPDNMKLRLQTHWNLVNNEIENLDILLVCNNAVWTGSINSWVLKERAHELNLQCKDYCDSLRHVFTSPWGPKNDTLNFKDGILIWRKLLGPESFIAYGDFNLDMVEDSGLLADTISSLIDANHSLREEFELISEKNSDIQKGWEDLKLYIEEMIKSKIQIETNLYAQFAAVLNEKKNKINDLRRGNC